LRNDIAALKPAGPAPTTNALEDPNMIRHPSVELNATLSNSPGQF
jgi:hypothetical protein